MIADEESLCHGITVLVLTFNEAPNIARTLEAVRWARRIVVVDSGSTDDTVAIARAFPQVDVVTRLFDTHQAQWSFALSLADSPWVLALDADYRITDELAEELRTLQPPAGIGGYRITFRYCVEGHPLRGSLYPPVVALYRREGARYVQEGHTQRIVVAGETGTIRGRIDHDDRKPLAHWLASQLRYARLEAEYVLAQPRRAGRPVDRLRRMAWPMPLIVLPYTLLWRGCILDGWPGWLYALQRLYAEIAIALEIASRRMRYPAQ